MAQAADAVGVGKGKPQAAPGLAQDSALAANAARVAGKWNNRSIDLTGSFNDNAALATGHARREDGSAPAATAAGVATICTEGGTDPMDSIDSAAGTAAGAADMGTDPMNSIGTDPMNPAGTAAGAADMGTDPMNSIGAAAGRALDSGPRLNDKPCCRNAAANPGTNPVARGQAPISSAPRTDIRINPHANAKQKGTTMFKFKNLLNAIKNSIRIVGLPEPSAAKGIAATKVGADVTPPCARGAGPMPAFAARAATALRQACAGKPTGKASVPQANAASVRAHARVCRTGRDRVRRPACAG